MQNFQSVEPRHQESALQMVKRDFPWNLHAGASIDDFPIPNCVFFFTLPCWVMGGPGTPNDWKAPDPEVDFILVRCLVQKSGMFHPKLVPDFAAANPQATPIWLDDFPVQPQFGSIILLDFRAIDSRRIYLFLSLVMFLSSVAIVGSCCGLWIGQIFDEMHVFP
jgi:hypothetical protein